ncbi:hypothetical protein TNCT_67141 [Trichonephila clavata]|uniref:Uncharacterized protein n=1 Tax=Trichonephila clavata TaxID=2740835 RepID=A0A8X6HKG4_TRICU|nr:hypothetical protein TNCT_67141 [Trichonephila clavata]
MQTQWSPDSTEKRDSSMNIPQLLILPWHDIFEIGAGFKGRTFIGYRDFRFASWELLTMVHTHLNPYSSINRGSDRNWICTSLVNYSSVVSTGGLSNPS